jgi:hypothetical protein
MLKQRFIIALLMWALMVGRSLPVLAQTDDGERVRLDVGRELARLQTQPAPDDNQRRALRRKALVELYAGGLLIPLGAVVVAKSNQSAAVTVGGRRVEISERSALGTVMGLAMVGAGGVAVWWGIQDFKEAEKRPALVFAVDRGVAVSYRRIW